MKLVISLWVLFLHLALNVLVSAGWHLFMLDSQVCIMLSLYVSNEFLSLNECSCYNYIRLTMSSLQRLYLSGLSIDNALQVSKLLQMLQLQLKLVFMTLV